MATAEVRAVWQRAVNRCFVQEDAKRAPKLACCQSSRATSKLFDFGAASAADESDHADVNVTLFNHKYSFSNVTPDSRWWLQLQPDYCIKKGLTCEQLNALEDELQILKARNGNKKRKDACSFGDDKHGYIYSMDGVVEACIEKSSENSEQVDMMAKHETMDIDSVSCSVSKKTNDFSMDSEYSLIGVEKAQPWWQTRDRDELACFVSHKSLDHIENCDLPPPRKYLSGQPGNDTTDIKIRTSFDSEAFSNFNVQAKGSVESGLMQRRLGPSTIKGNLHSDFDIYSSYLTEQIFEEDPSKVQLMEALCHSQTRARKAEEIAKQACAEKRHIIALFFMQASQLFAYKQWFQVLQLESLKNQLENKDQPTTIFQGIKLGKRKQKIGNAKQEILEKPNITTYAVAFALGLSLVGAGLLLGWTVGCMLPCS
ncbi:hypothetical protein LR48_Vigan181s002500 [Vigna angularis]|uniref:Uncharacterized protein n=2 Tax=Phaseolus angularis TaxID=3914 RepID=A0A0L9T587_PHAAN|nr:uncharacterized protein LOC108319247 [Vigna angularis]KAG2380193.1 uncharacterized protein HKW66_Vig0169720 [Vigna angularis]KOM25747.1 hypothetical protein LR48_Vigan181s002500 [Vigna angularis]BAT98110.1 hypothetical protein VIGAN_09173300 [Vigna angularis var. angularis]